MTTIICRSLACTPIVIAAILNLLVEETVDLVNWGMLHWGLGVNATLLHYLFRNWRQPVHIGG